MTISVEVSDTLPPGMMGWGCLDDCEMRVRPIDAKNMLYVVGAAVEHELATNPDPTRQKYLTDEEKENYQTNKLTPKAGHNVVIYIASDVDPLKIPGAAQSFNGGQIPIYGGNDALAPLWESKTNSPKE